MESFFLPLDLVTLAIGMLMGMVHVDLAHACVAGMALLPPCHCYSIIVS